jgi:uncharacterized protein YpmB
MKVTALQLGVLALVIAGFVVLTLKGQDTAAYIGVMTPILTAVFVIEHVNVRSDAQDQALAKITHQTNGVLTERINTAVTEAMTKALEGKNEAGA